jgi:peptidoglycan/xylan/chitin deacetylase (PgdA/CDA1 family)
MNLREVIKRAGLTALSASGALRFSEFLARGNVRVLTYHRVIPRSSWDGMDHPPNTLFTDEFDAQMAYIAKRFHVLSGQELRSVIAGAAAPAHSVVITFDDGYENNCTEALPILQKYGLHAVFFISSNLIGDPKAAFWFDRLDRVLAAADFTSIRNVLGEIDGRDVPATRLELRKAFKRMSYERQDKLLTLLEERFAVGNCAEANAVLYRAMTWDQVRQLVGANMTIGSHTLNHQILSAVDAEQAAREVEQSRKKIEAETGVECWCFGYPNGTRADFRASDQEAVRRAGYECAFTQCPGAIDGVADRYALPRIPVPDVGDITILRTHVSGLQRRIGMLLGA